MHTYLPISRRFAAGLLLTLAACAVERPACPAPLPAGELLSPSGDAKLDALRHWAVIAPVDEFVRVWNRWWSEFYFDYPSDAVLWRGADRLAAWALQHRDAAGQNFLGALVLASTQDPRGQSWLRSQQAELRALRAQRLADRAALQRTAQGAFGAPGQEIVLRVAPSPSTKQ